jgi:hypothetical protein
MLLLTRLTRLVPLALLLLLLTRLTRLTRLVPLALLLLLLVLLAQLARLQALLPSSLMLVALLLLLLLLLPPAQVQVPGGRCCVRQLLHCLLQLHWNLQQLHCRLPRALLCLRLLAQQMQQRLVLSLALPRCALLGLQSCF